LLITLQGITSAVSDFKFNLCDFFVFPFVDKVNAENVIMLQ